MGTELKSAQCLVGFLGFLFAPVIALDRQQFASEDAGSLSRQFLYSYQPGGRNQQYSNDINKPVFHAELGLSPQYRDLVYDYVKGFGGTDLPPRAHTFQPNNFLSSGTGNKVDSQSQQGDLIPAGSLTEKFGGKPGLNEYFLPSDILSLPDHPGNRFQGNIDEFKLKLIELNSQPTSLPPLGGILSDYILLRNQMHLRNWLRQHSEKVNETESDLQHNKRETSEEDDDSVVVVAEPMQNQKKTEEAAEHKENDKEEDKQNEKEDDQSSIAQSKPSAIALAGPGGVAQASPVGTALVGNGGLAISAPSGTAIAGRTGGISIPIGGERQKSLKERDNVDSR